MKTSERYFILVRYSQESRVQEVALDSSSFVVGRSTGVEVLIDELSISRQHLQIYFDGQKIEFEDMGSSNGTFYKNKRISKGQRTSYDFGQKIKLGVGETYVWFELVGKEISTLPDDTDGILMGKYDGPIAPRNSNEVEEVNAIKQNIEPVMSKGQTRTGLDQLTKEEQQLRAEHAEMQELKKRTQAELEEIEKKVQSARTEAERIIQDALRMQNEIAVDREKADIEFQRTKKMELEKFNQEMKLRRENESMDSRKRREEFETELVGYEKQRLNEIRSLEKEFEIKQELFVKDKEAFELLCKQKMLEIDNIKKEAMKFKELTLLEAQEKAYAENKKYADEIQWQLEQAKNKYDEALSLAKLDAEKTKANAESESRAILEKAKETSTMIRKTAEEENKIFRERKDRELLILQQRAEEDCKTILLSAESRKAEILQQAEMIVQEASKEAADRTLHAKSLFEKIETEANLEKQKLLQQFELEISASKSKAQAELEQQQSEVNRLKQMQAELLREQAVFLEKGEQERNNVSQLQSEILVLQTERNNIQSEKNTLVQQAQLLKNEVNAFEAQRAELLTQASDLQRENEQATSLAKQSGEKILAEYEKVLEDKKAQEVQIIEQKRLELSMEFKSEEARMRKVFAEQSKLISKNLVKFLQIYHFENKSFDFKNLNEAQLKDFENVFYNNLLVETKTDPSQAVHVVGEKIVVSKQSKQYALFAMGLLMLILAIPQFLPPQQRQKFSLIDRLNPSLGADRYIASLKQDRDRRYTPEKVRFVFENFRLNVMYSVGFVEKWKSDAFQKRWVKHMQNHFYNKYRISEEVMIQVASKEAALVESLGKMATEIHPDFFKISFEKMHKEESQTMAEIQRLLANENAYAEYRQQAFDFFTNQQ